MVRRSINRPHAAVGLLAAFFAIAPTAGETPPAGPLTAVPFDSERWRVEAEESRVEQHLGRSSLYLRDGTAWIDDVEFVDGVVEFDVAFTGQRGFMGAMWRRVGGGNYEEFYVRPHQSGNPDANQYTPAFDGLTSWQLYHGPGYGAPLEYRFNQWNTIRVVFAGDQAEVYVNDMDRPALFIPDQKRELGAGKVGVNAFFAPAHFSAFRFRAGDPPAFRSPRPDPVKPPDGAVTAWEVSDAFDWAALGDRPELPGELAGARKWRRLDTEASGLANLASVTARGEGRNAVFARVTLRSEVPRTVRVRFGFSDVVRVFLNGRAIYAGDNRYRSRDYRYLGTIGYFDQVYLPLEAGPNHLWFAVAENFGGWGLQATLEDADGITVEP